MSRRSASRRRTSNRHKSAAWESASRGRSNSGTTKVKFAPNLDWADVDFERLYWLRGWPLVVENDVRMGTYGEYAHGGGPRCPQCPRRLFVGTGVGGGLRALNGELFTGFNGNAGEIGHLIIHWRQGTHLEGIAGRKYMMKRAKDILDDAQKTCAEGMEGRRSRWRSQFALAEYYQQAMIPLRCNWSTMQPVRRSGPAIGGVVNFLNPEVIVVGGGVAQARSATDVHRTHLGTWHSGTRCPGGERNSLCAAALGDDSGIVGCAAYAKAHPPAIATADAGLMLLLVGSGHMLGEIWKVDRTPNQDHCWRFLSAQSCGYNQPPTSP